MVWNTYANFSTEFLEHYHPILLQETFNRIKALLLYPPTCSCTPPCQCQNRREQVTLTLNTELYNSLEQSHPHLDLYTLRLFLKIKEDNAFRKQYGDAYPLWLIQEKLVKRHKAQHFKSVDQLVWTLLKLGLANSSPIFGLQTSLRGAIEKLLGPLPLKRHRQESSKSNPICGEKAYMNRFHTYK